MYSLFQSVYKFFYKHKKSDVQNINLVSTEPYEIDKPENIQTEYDKNKRISTFLQIRHVKNIFYKYTENPLYRHQLYDEFLKESDFDYGESAFDDEKHDICIFDKYVCDYIQLRKEFLDKLIQSNISFTLSSNKTENNIQLQNTNDMIITFIIDMNDRNILDYCLSHCDQKLLDILFSAIITETETETENHQTYTRVFR